MAHSVEEMLDTILRHEGGYVDDPADRGGATNMGITQSVLAEWRGRAVTKDEVRRLTENEARQIYRARYFSGPKIDTLAEELQPLVFDMCVNHGPGGAIRIFQRALKSMGYACDVDGGIGANTRECLQRAIAENGWQAVNNAIVAERQAFYRRLVEQDNKQRRFLTGWLRRADSFRV
jgi:lysozyme family protein